MAAQPQARMDIGLQGDTPERRRILFMTPSVRIEYLRRNPEIEAKFPEYSRHGVEGLQFMAGRYYTIKFVTMPRHVRDTFFTAHPEWVEYFPNVGREVGPLSLVANGDEGHPNPDEHTPKPIRLENLKELSPEERARYEDRLATEIRPIYPLSREILLGFLNELSPEERARYFHVCPYMRYDFPECQPPDGWQDRLIKPHPENTGVEPVHGTPKISQNNGKKAIVPAGSLSFLGSIARKRLEERVSLANKIRAASEHPSGSPLPNSKATFLELLNEDGISEISEHPVDRGWVNQNGAPLWMDGPNERAVARGRMPRQK